MGRNINVHLLIFDSRDFFPHAFGILVFPLGLNFIMMLDLCKRLLQVLTLPVKCRKL